MFISDGLKCCPQVYFCFYSLKKVNKPKRRLQSLMFHSWWVLTSYFSKNVYDFLTVKTSSKWMHGAARYTGFLPFFSCIQVLSSVWPSHLDQDKRSMKQMRIKQKSKFLCVFLSVLPKIMMFIIGVMETFGGCGPPCGENVRSPVVMCRPPWWFMEVGPADQSVTINSGVGSIF